MLIYTRYPNPKIDPIAIVGIISGLTGLLIGILSHVKHSECFKGLFVVDTYSPDTMQAATDNSKPIEIIPPTAPPTPNAKKQDAISASDV